MLHLGQANSLRNRLSVESVSQCALEELAISRFIPSGNLVLRNCRSRLPVTGPEKTSAFGSDRLLHCLRNRFAGHHPLRDFSSHAGESRRAGRFGCVSRGGIRASGTGRSIVVGLSTPREHEPGGSRRRPPDGRAQRPEYSAPHDGRDWAVQCLPLAAHTARLGRDLPGWPTAPATRSRGRSRRQTASLT